MFKKQIEQTMEAKQIPDPSTAEECKQICEKCDLVIYKIKIKKANR